MADRKQWKNQDHRILIRTGEMVSIFSERKDQFSFPCVNSTVKKSIIYVDKRETGTALFRIRLLRRKHSFIEQIY